MSSGSANFNDLEMRDVIYIKLCRGAVDGFACDCWNSLQILSRLQLLGFGLEKATQKKNDFLAHFKANKFIREV